MIASWRSFRTRRAGASDKREVEATAGNELT